MAKILIVGTGAYGSALANVLLFNKHQVYMYCINQNEYQDLIHNCNKKYFGNLKFFGNFACVSNDLKKLLENKPDIIILSIPSQFIFDLTIKITSLLKNKPIFINVSKGLNGTSLDLWLNNLKKVIKNKSQGLVSLIGPGFAKEIFKQQITAINVVSDDQILAKKVAKIFKTNFFRCFIHQDEKILLCGICKNVMAIAFGLISSFELPNTKALIFTQAIKETNQIILAAGGLSSTILSFSGVGDLYLSCNSEKSRNFSFGKTIAKYGIKKALVMNKLTVEGYSALKILNSFCQKKKINSPIIFALYNVVYKNKQAKDFVKEILKKIK